MTGYRGVTWTRVGSSVRPRHRPFIRTLDYVTNIRLELLFATTRTQQPIQ